MDDVFNSAQPTDSPDAGFIENSMRRCGCAPCWRTGYFHQANKEASWIAALAGVQTVQCKGRRLGYTHRNSTHCIIHREAQMLAPVCSGLG